MVGRQTPFLALVVPLILMGMVDGARGIRQAWPAAVVGGLVFAVAQFLCSNYVSVEMTDIVAALSSTGAIVLLLRVWQPSEPLIGRQPTRAASRGRPWPAPRLTIRRWRRRCAGAMTASRTRPATWCAPTRPT